MYAFNSKFAVFKRFGIVQKVFFSTGILFLAVQNSSIGDLVTDSVTQSLTHFYL